MSGPDIRTVAAVDLGASSGRVVVGRFSPDGATLREVHRFANRPVRIRGTLRWDILALYRGILDGLRLAEDAAGRLDSVGVDSWAVDYGLLDEDGELLGNPAHYRDGRTAPVVAEVLDRVGAEILYAATGVQHQPFNTVFQLLSDAGTARRRAARQALLVPDLIDYWLCGAQGTELTNASTTGLLDPRTRTWSDDLVRRGLGSTLFPALHRPGTVLGQLADDVRREAGLASAPLVVAVPSHDTAAAVAGVPAAGEGFAFVCTGTWALVGVELPEPVINRDAQAANFSNELGADDTVRFLRNVTGFWLLQECVRSWQAAGVPCDLGELTRAAAAVPPLRAVVDVQDPAFLAPGDMPRRISRAASGVTPTSPAEITRCIIDSMALAIRQAVRSAGRLSAREVEVVHVVGGGVANDLFCRILADACELPVLAGPIEAAAWGNAVAQAQALGAVAPGLAAGRAVVGHAERPGRHDPRPDTAAEWSRADDLVLGVRA